MLNIAAIDIARELLPRIAHELPTPYIFEHPADLPTPKDCGAYAPVGHTNVLLRDHLIAAGDWRGPAPMIVLVESSRVVDDTLGIILHEAAHHLPCRSIPDVEATDASRAECLALTTAWAERTSECKLFPNWWPGHGRSFVRICLHLHFRTLWHWHAARIDHPQSLPLDKLRFAGGDYHLSSPYEYRRALGTEPAQMIDASFAEILSTPEPPAFAELFDSDYERWREQSPQLTNLEKVA